MNPNLAFEIVDLALNVAKNQTTGKVQQGVELGGALLKIIAKAVQAYEDHTGQPLDLSLIRPETM